MKKAVFLVLCLALTLAALTGCSSGEPFAERSYTPDAQVTGIQLDVEDREIEVSPSEDGLVHIQYSENSKEYYDISVSDENVLTMTSASNKQWTDYIGAKPAAEDRKILLQVPDTLLESLALSTTNEDITLCALTVTGSVTISNNGGNIAFENLDVGNALELAVKNGNISGTVVGGYDDFAIQTEIKKGDSNLPESKEGGEKTLNASANNGDISIEFISE